MIRKLLATTAIVSVSATLAMADTQPANQEPISVENQIMMQDVRTVGDVDVRGFLASNMIGQYVYAASGADAETVGDINDFVFADDGSINAVIVGVGGFLGIAERDVAIDFNRLTLSRANNGSTRISTDLNREELEAATPYERPEWATWDGIRDRANQLGEQTNKMLSDTTAAVRDGLNSPTEADGNHTISAEEKQAWLDGKTELDLATVKADALIGASVYASSGDRVGEVSQFQTQGPDMLKGVIVDVGGFFGFGEKPVMVSSQQMTIYRDNASGVHVMTTMTKQDFKSAPAYDRSAMTNETTSTDG